MSDAPYKPKNILVTGGAGFIASHMVLYLVAKYPEYNIVNLDKMDYCSSTYYFKETEKLPNYHFVKGDILSADLITYVLKTHNIDTIMHFAAQSHVDNSFGNSITFTTNNVLGTHVLLECAKAHKLSRFIHVSTDEVYGETAYNDLTLEAAVLAPTNPYAASKAAAEHLVESYWKSFKLPLVITRSNNVFGPHQFPEKLIPKFICRLERGMPCCIHGAGTTRRSFLYVLDAVRAYDLVLHKGTLGHIYNIEAGEELSVMQVTRALLKAYGYDQEESKWLETVPDRAFNDLRYHIDGKKLKDLGFEATWSFEDGLAETIKWYKSININEVWVEAEHALSAHPKAVAAPSSVTPKPQ
jgi:dTDP-glucose 4,6-dehydratase